MRANEETINSEIEKFQTAVNTIAEEGVSIVLKGSRSLDLLLSDPEVALKIQTSARAISGAWGAFYSTYMRAAMTLGNAVEEEIDSFDSTTTRFALKHPIKALEIKSNLASMEHSWAKIKGLFSTPKVVKTAEQKRAEYAEGFDAFCKEYNLKKDMSSAE